MSTLTADQVITLLTDYTKQTGVPVDVLLVGALALQAYGYQNRLTRDVDAEVVGSVEALAEFFSQHHIPADLTENFSGWSIVAKPPGYRERATDFGPSLASTSTAPGTPRLHYRQTPPRWENIRSYHRWRAIRIFGEQGTK